MCYIVVKVVGDWLRLADIGTLPSILLQFVTLTFIVVTEALQALHGAATLLNPYAFFCAGSRRGRRLHASLPDVAGRQGIFLQCVIIVIYLYYIHVVIYLIVMHIVEHESIRTYITHSL